MLAAVDDADGAIAGFTEVELSGWTPAHSEQADTAVLAAHRGHGLWLKAAMLRRPGRSHANPVRSYSSGVRGASRCSTATSASTPTCRQRPPDDRPGRPPVWIRGPADR